MDLVACCYLTNAAALGNIGLAKAGEYLLGGRKMRGFTDQIEIVQRHQIQYASFACWVDRF